MEMVEGNMGIDFGMVEDRTTLEEPQFIVIGNGWLGDDIYYYGESEIEAQKHYKRAMKQGSTKTNIYKAYITTMTIHGIKGIENYEIIKKIK